MSAGEGRLETAKEELKVAEGKQEAAKEELKVAVGKLEAAEGKLEAAEGKLEAATDPKQQAIAQKGYDLAVQGVERAGENVNTARENVNTARRAVNIALDAVQRVLDAVQRAGADAPTMMQQESFQAMMQQQQESFQATIMQFQATMQSQIASLGHNDPWEGLSSTSSTSPDFRARLSAFYGSTNCLLTSRDGTAAHIWPRSRGFSMPTGLGVDHPKNGMFLLKAIESAFDKRQVCFLCDPFRRSITFKVLDPNLKGQSVGSTAQVFQDLEGKPKCFKDDKRPSFDLLSRHAKSAIRFAMRQNTISEQDGAKLLETVVVSSPPREHERESLGSSTASSGKGGSAASSGSVRLRNRRDRSEDHPGGRSS